MSPALRSDKADPETRNEGKEPLVAVVVPARDCAATIVAQLEALRRQECDFPFTVVVADNGSTDGTGGLAQSYCAPLGWTVVDACTRPGATVARNVGTHWSTAPIVAHCDADDIASQTWLNELVKPLRLHPRVGIVGGRLDYEALNPRRAREARVPVQSAELPRDLGHLRFTSSANMAVRRSAFDAVGGWDERFLCGCDDVDFAWRVQDRGFEIAWAGDAVMHYRLKPSVRDNARQVRRYAEATPLLYHKHREQGARRRRLRGTVYLWLRPVVTLPWLADRRRRGNWLVKANRLVGYARGSIIHRVVYL